MCGGYDCYKNCYTVIHVFAGLFQLTPWKESCLRRCRTPIGFLIAEWREGAAGALIMGVRHGAYCVGCCWLLMAVRFVVGTMHLVWMAVVTVVVLAEKVAARALRVGLVSALFLIGDSHSAGEVLVVGAVDPRMTAIVAQIPVCGSEPPTLEPTLANFDAIRVSLLDGDVAGAPEVTVGPLPVVSADQLGTPSLLEPVQAFRWFMEHGARHRTGCTQVHCSTRRPASRPTS